MDTIKDFLRPESNHCFLRCRGLDSSACLPDYGHRDKYSVDNIHSLLSIIVVVFAEMAQGNIYRSQCVQTGPERGP